MSFVAAGGDRRTTRSLGKWRRSSSDGSGGGGSGSGSGLLGRAGPPANRCAAGCEVYPHIAELMRTIFLRRIILPLLCAVVLRVVGVMLQAKIHVALIERVGGAATAAARVVLIAVAVSVVI